MLWLATAAIVAAHAWIVYSRALNIPSNDDLQDVLFFLLAMSESDSVGSSLDALFAQHADHMTAASRLVYWLIWQIEDHINFRQLAIIAPIGILLWGWLLYLHFSGNPNRHIALLLAAMCLLNPRAYTLMTWPMAAMEFYFSFFYAFAMLVCLEKRRPAFFLLAMLAATMATFSFTPGILTWPVGLLFLVYLRHQGTQISYRKLAIWLLTATLVLSLFTTLFSPGSASSTTMLSFIAERPFYTLQFYLAIAGSIFSYGSSTAAICLGALLVTAAVLQLIKDFGAGLNSLHFFTIYCLCALALLTIGRAHASTVALFVEPLLLELSLTARYAFISMMLLASVIGLYLSSKRELVSSGISFGLAIIGALLLFNFHEYLPQLDTHRELRIQRYQQNGLVPQFYPPTRVNSRIEKIISSGIYQPPKPSDL